MLYSPSYLYNMARDYNWPLCPTGGSAIFWTLFFRKNHEMCEVQVLFFSIPFITFALFFRPLLVVTQIKGHVSGSSPPRDGGPYLRHINIT